MPETARAQETSASPALNPWPTKLFVETTTRCNLRCEMCVKQTGGSGLVEGDLSLETFLALAPAWPRLDSLVLSGIGEPLLHPRLEQFIRLGRQGMPSGAWVGFQTNGLLLDRARARSLAGAGLDRICISIDSAEPDTLRRIRQGCEVGALDRALSSLARAKREAGRPGLDVGVEFVAMRDNVRDLPATLAWVARRGASFALVTQMLPYEGRLVDQAAYDPNTDRAVRFFDPWRERARREGISLERYFEVLWKYVKDPEEQRIIDFVEEIKADARARDIYLNVQEILHRDDAWLEEVEEVFAKASEVARENGIDLRLPAVVPCADRRCEFVEEGGVFVAWDGRVHPCYFLWHDYRCFVNGREKFVKGRVVGDLARRGILEIWNDSGYRGFRENLLKYDYPFCSDCNLGKCCDYVQAEEFEQDCYINHEPCGDCLWCKGVFQCLR